MSNPVIQFKSEKSCYAKWPNGILWTTSTYQVLWIICCSLLFYYSIVINVNTATATKGNGVQCDQMVKLFGQYLAKFGLLQPRKCVKNSWIAKTVVFKVWPIPNKISTFCQKPLNVLLICRNFAKSGHTDGGRNVSLFVKRRQFKTKKWDIFCLAFYCGCLQQIRVCHALYKFTF